MGSWIFKLNNNENIGFNHQYFDAKLTALMPPYIKCSSATIKSLSEGCEIQVESRSENENVERNTLAYNCRLSIPKDLTDTLTVHNYYYSLNIEDEDEKEYYKEKIEFSIEDITETTVQGKQKLTFYVDNETYQIKGDKGLNTLKYMHMYYHIKYLQGNNENYFLGI